VEHIAATLRRFDGPDTRLRLEPCACGGVIRANRFEPAVYVSNHNRSKQHKAWRERMGYDAR
jgi:hypothetical protein